MIIQEWLSDVLQISIVRDILILYLSFRKDSAIRSPSSRTITPVYQLNYFAFVMTAMSELIRREIIFAFIA